MPRLVYLFGVALVLVTGAFLLTDALLGERPLDLRARCEKMLAMQLRVHHGTWAVDRAIAGTDDQKPTPANVRDALHLAAEQRQIVREANKVIRMLEAEGSAVAFLEVFMQVRDDMEVARHRLNGTDVGRVTQAIEQDIIDTLKEMIAALTKPKRELLA